MNWEDEGYLLSKKKFRENAIIIDVFTQNYGAILSIAQVFNYAAFIVLKDLPVLARLTTEKIPLCFLWLCS